MEKIAMMLQINKAKRNLWLKRCGAILMTVMFIALVVSDLSLAENVNQLTFASPEEAVRAMVEALNSNDLKALEAIFGSGSLDFLTSGDPVADKSGREQFLKLYDEKNRLEQTADKAVLSIGNEDWPFPIPMVKKDADWRFDTEEGREEILARRIGRNELSVIQVCLAYVDAQREYALKDRNGDGFLEYAQKFASESGKKDGLYWKVKEGDELSPLGPLVGAAQEQGYTGKKSGGKPIPYHGYYYRILNAQGKDAKGGDYNYVVKGKMIGGFALVAYPAQYGSSGIMTFIVSHAGEIFQKDLGENTENSALKMKLFNPDSMWKKLEEKDMRTKG
jgi:hypothetical protein